jgi:hypothetical protein
MTRETVRFGRNIELLVSLGIQEPAEASKQPLFILGCKLVLLNLGNYMSVLDQICPTPPW